MGTAAVIALIAAAIFQVPRAWVLHFALRTGARTLLIAPRVEGKPVPVTVKLDILNISRIDEAHETFTLDGYLSATWNDARLAFNANPGDEVERIYQPGDVWTPSFTIINATMPRQSLDRSLTVASDGIAHYSERFHAVLSTRFRLRAFPFDRQALVLRIQPYINDTGTERFIPDLSGSGLGLEEHTYSSLAQWHVESLTGAAVAGRAFRGMQVAELDFTVSMVRKYEFYLWKIFLPLVLMVVLSWAVFWVHPEDLNNQVQLAVTTILTVIAFAFAIEATMPRMSYLTFADGFFLTCYVFVFISIVELMTVHVVLRQGKTDLGMRVRATSRWAVPAAFVAINAILIVHFLI